MDIGKNLYDLVVGNAQNLVLVALVIIGVYFGFKREFTKLIGVVIVAAIAVGFVFNANGVKDLLLTLFNTVFGSSAAYINQISLVVVYWQSFM